jgi:hypothetical protein
MRTISSLSSSSNNRNNKRSLSKKKNVWVNKNAGASAGQKKQWPKYTLGLAMDKPCVFHTF